MSTEILDDFNKPKKKTFSWYPRLFWLLVLLGIVSHIFRIIHWPGADLLLIGSSVSLMLGSIFLLPRYADEGRQVSKQKYVIVTLGLLLAITLMGILFHFNLWRGSTQMLYAVFPLAIYSGIVLFTSKHSKSAFRFLSSSSLLAVAIGAFSLAEGPVDRFAKYMNDFQYGFKAPQKLIDAFENHYYAPNNKNYEQIYLKYRAEYLEYVNVEMNRNNMLDGA